MSCKVLKFIKFQTFRKPKGGIKNNFEKVQRHYRKQFAKKIFKEKLHVMMFLILIKSEKQNSLPTKREESQNYRWLSNQSIKDKEVFFSSYINKSKCNY